MRGLQRAQALFPVIDSVLACCNTAHIPNGQLTKELWGGMPTCPPFTTHHSKSIIHHSVDKGLGSHPNKGCNAYCSTKIKLETPCTPKLNNRYIQLWNNNSSKKETFPVKPYTVF